MAVSVDGFRSRFPEFAESSDERIEDRLVEGAAFHSISERGTYYACAHLLALDSEMVGVPDGGSGVITSESLGPHSVSYETVAASSGRAAGDGRRVFFATTAYGRRLLALESRLPRLVATAKVVG